MTASDRKRVTILIGVAIVLLISYLYILEKYHNEDFEHWSRIWEESLKKGPSTTLSFADTMKSIPWKRFKQGLDAHNHSEIERYATDVLLKLVPFLIRHPQTPVDESCRPPPLQMIEKSNECNALQKPRKVGILWQLGFDVDALEIHLNELDAVVDKFFILESVRAHSSYIRSKPLIWDRLRYDSRFAAFSEKVVHFIVDDASLVTSVGAGKDIWQRESQQELLRWERFLEWNKVSKYFGENDLLGFGDADEVPDRDQVNFLKHCQMPSDPVDIGIWFPFDGIDTVFTTDWPVSGHPQTLGDPTFWTVGNAKAQWYATGKTPSRNRGTSFGHLVGGMHLSRYAYPPFQMAKCLTASEADMDGLRRVVEAGIQFSQNDEDDAREILNAVPWNLAKRIEPLYTFQSREKSEAEIVVKMPWFLKCNRKRFQGFDKLYDTRLDEIESTTDNPTNDTIGII